MIKKIYPLFLSLFIFSSSVIAQLSVDSLKNLLIASKEDTVKVNVLNSLSGELRSSNTSQSLEYARQALALAEQLKFKSGLISAHNNIGIADYFTGSYPDALRHYIEATKLLEGTGNKKRLSATYNNIAALYLEQGQYPDAENYFRKSLKMDEAIGDKLGMAQSYNNIGTIYHDQNKDDDALICYFKSLHLREMINDVEGLPSTYTNIGNSLINKKDYVKSNEYLTKALQCYKKNGDTMGISLAFVNLGDLFSEQKNYSKAINFYDSSIVISKKNNYRDYLSYAYQAMARLNAEKGDFENAYSFHQLYMNVKDSIYNKDNAAQISEMQTKYETEKKEKEITLLTQDKKIKEDEMNRQTLINRGVIIVGILSILLTLLAVRGYSQKKRANILLGLKNRKIENAYNIIEDQHKDIKDSINYAKRIQMVILPPDTVFKQLLPQSFILYKPKDIVSGDFYWAEPWGNKILFAAVDCTGHGVPGAFMSIVGYNLLGKALNELGLSSPSLILNSISKEIGKTLRQTGADSEVKDGMDIAVCSLDNQTLLLEYSGAFNSLYYIREGNLTEIKADKNPIGSLINGKLENYTNHKIQLQKGDSIYIFTDGYADQFGGEKGKKFKYRSFEKLLVSVQDRSMEEQKIILNKTIEEWQGNLEQVDDILIMGVRI